MLTQGDFSQIQKIIVSETRKIIQEETPGIVRKIVQEETPKIIQKELIPIKRDIKKIKKDVDIIVTTFDRDYVFLRRRLDRLEDHLQLPPYPSA